MVRAPLRRRKGIDEGVIETVTVLKLHLNAETQRPEDAELCKISQSGRGRPQSGTLARFFHLVFLLCGFAP